MGLFDKLFSSKVKETDMLQPPINQTNRSYVVQGYGTGSFYALLKTLLPGSFKDWRATSGDLMLNEIVAVNVDWYCRNFTQAKPVVKISVNGEEEIIDHPIIKLLKRPQIDTTSSQFYSNIITDLKINGNAYARKVRNSDGTIGTLQYLPADSMVPIGNKTNYLTHYVYSNSSYQTDISLDDLIIFKIGRNPDDLRLGRSPLMAGLKSISTDNAISTTAYAVMNNGPYPSMIVSPDKTNGNVEVSVDDARAVKKQLQTSFSGDNASGVVVMNSPMNIEKVSMSPKELAFDEVRNAPILRICSLMGLNPLALGLTMDNATYNNLKNATQSCWQDGMIPLLTILAESFTDYLLPEYFGTPEDAFVAYDLSNVRELMDDKLAEADRAVKLYTSGICSLADAKRIAGFEPENSDENQYFTSNEPLPSIMSLKAKEDYIPTDKMAANAKKGLELRAEFGRGGTAVGVARANQLIDKENLSEETVKRMFSYFSRHEVDKDAEGFREGEEGYPSAGKIAWLLWGGDEGFSWSKNIVADLKEDE